MQREDTVWAQPFPDTMKRLHGEIERMIYSAEILCMEGGYGNGTCSEETCGFHKRGFCKLIELRDLIGDIEHHNPETP
jgi:hypothetical protein